MDGNGRWARGQGLPRTAGHRAGVEAVRRAVEAAPGLGIRILTLYTFSSDNWQRPRAEVNTLFQLFQEHLARELPRLRENGVRLTVIGRRDRFPLSLRSAIAAAERLTARCSRLDLRLAMDYSSRDQILRAATLARGASLGRERFSALLGHAGHSHGPSPDVDLLIRTGGEKRLSDFLLWECAYAELVFTDVAWPDFGPEHLAQAVEEFRRRDRRFGQVKERTS